MILLILYPFFVSFLTNTKEVLLNLIVFNSQVVKIVSVLRHGHDF